MIFAAGHDTSATALTWTLFLLAQHPQVAADLHAELDSVLHGAAPTVAQLLQLPLLDRVVKESLRVLPPVPWNGWVVAQPTELGGYVLPAGTAVLIRIYHTHHMPDLFLQPEVFDPRRWEMIAPSVFEYNPFSSVWYNHRAERCHESLGHLRNVSIRIRSRSSRAVLPYCPRARGHLA